MTRSASLFRRLWFPAILVVASAVAFVLLGPPSSVSSVDRLRAMAPPGAGTEAAVAPPDATATEQEIFKQYEVVRQYPDTVTSYVLLGNAYVQNVREQGDPSDYGRAQAAFDEALRREPENVDALVGKGVLALARHEFAAALELGARALDLAPRTARVYGLLVDAQTELGRYDEALATTQQMVDLRPDLASYSRVSYQRELHGQLDAAIVAMKQAFDASVGTSLENREYLRVLIGDLYARSGDLATAEATYQASLDTSPGFVWALAGMARVRAAQGRPDDAVAMYQQAVDTIPLPEFVIALGETQEAAGLDTDAARSYELARAIQRLFQANGVNVDLDLALFEANHGDARTAVDLASRAYEATPNIKAADALAWALYKAGRYDEARTRSDEALRLGTPYGQFLFHAGMIAVAQGDVEGARSYLSRAIEVDPHFSPLYGPAAADALRGLATP